MLTYHSFCSTMGFALHNPTTLQCWLLYSALYSIQPAAAEQVLTTRIRELRDLADHHYWSMVNNANTP